jgi:hypothetical protein
MKIKYFEVHEIVNKSMYIFSSKVKNAWQFKREFQLAFIKYFRFNYTIDSRYLELDGTMEKIRVNRSSTHEELRKYRKRGLFNNERETTRAKF